LGNFYPFAVKPLLGNSLAFSCLEAVIHLGFVLSADHYYRGMVILYQPVSLGTGSRRGEFINGIEEGDRSDV
jgi:hypothetical protein